MPGGLVTGILYALSIFIVNALGVTVFCRCVTFFGLLLDRPNSRSTHQDVTCRGAGVIFVWSTLLSWTLIEYCSSEPFLLPLLCGATLIAVIGFVDDLQEVSIKSRLLIQIVSASLFVSQIPLPDLLVDAVGGYAVLWRLPAVFFIVAVTNIYNFMDGLDGLTAGHSCVVLSSWIAFSGLLVVPFTEMLVCVALLVPLFGFLVCNWHPARAFMGDVGSTFVGFTFSCLALMQIGDLPRLINFFALIMLMMPFLFDATFTIVSRYLRGECWYRPHRLHIFQRIYDQGVSQAHTVCVYIVLTMYMGALLLLVRSSLLESFVLGTVFFMAPYPTLYCWLWWLEQGQTRNSEAKAVNG